MTRRGLARFARPAPGADARTPRGAGGGATTDGAPRGGAAQRGAPVDGDAAGGGSADLQLPPGLAQYVGTRARPTPGESCELCAVAVPDDHRHVVDLERRALLCACRGCALLFERTDDVASDTGPGVGPDRTRYRAVPDRYVEVAPCRLPAPAWSALQIPVGIAFVVANSKLGRTVAFYPSPGGATESELPLDAWADVVAANPPLADVAPDVEAVLLRTGVGDPTCHVVPVDRCYELVGAMRLHWRGFDGGSEVRGHIAAFFDDVTARARPARTEAHP